MAEIRVNAAGNGDGEEWNSYLTRKGCNDHSLCWGWRKVIFQTFGHQPHYLVARKNGVVVGVLPLFEVKGFLFGHAFVSVPYLNGGGIFADDDEAKLSLLSEAKELSKVASYIELRQREDIPSLNNLECRTHKVAMVLALKDDPEQLFESFPAKLRSQIRRPEKSGARVETAEDDRLLEPFYRVFSENMRDLGTPVYPKKLFYETMNAKDFKVKTFVVWYEGQAVSAGVTIGLGNRTEILWASSLWRFNFFSPNMMLYWHAIRSACQSNFLFFDFGRSTPNSGTYRFKKQWGANEIQLYWYYQVNRGSIPDINPQSKKFKLLVKCWQKLPLIAANNIGPLLTKSLP